MIEFAFAAIVLLNIILNGVNALASAWAARDQPVPESGDETRQQKHCDSGPSSGPAGGVFLYFNKVFRPRCDGWKRIGDAATGTLSAVNTRLTSANFGDISGHPKDRESVHTG
jgi:hypothetical protein